MSQENADPREIMKKVFLGVVIVAGIAFIAVSFFFAVHLGTSRNDHLARLPEERKIVTVRESKLIHLGLTTYINGVVVTNPDVIELVVEDEKGERSAVQWGRGFAPGETLEMISKYNPDGTVAFRDLIFSTTSR